MRIPYVDLAAAARSIEDDMVEAVRSVIASGHYVLGPQVSAFEDAFASLCGVPHAVGVNSGTDALVLALRALDIGLGDEVITVPNSFVATASAIRMVGATVRLIDVADHYNMDPVLLEAAITPRTKAIIPVHLTGRPAPMADILEIANSRGISVIEDAAQAVGARLGLEAAGSLGTLACFSLHPLKTLGGCGDGGVITTKDPKIAERLKCLRNLGKTNRDDCEEWSGNSRLDELQAAILNVKLPYLEQWTAARRAHAAGYQSALAEHVHVPVDSTEEHSVYHTFVVRAQNRDALQQHLSNVGIGSAIHYPIPIHLQTAGKELGYQPGDFPVAEAQAKNILSLPVYPELTEEQQALVIQEIKHFYAKQPVRHSCAFPSPT